MSGQNLLLLGAVQQAVPDPYFEYTTLLLPGNGTNGAQNNTFLDSSTNAFSITRNGNTTQGTFSPFSQTGWGNYFDGTGDWLSLASNSAFNLGTGEFTVECWVYLTNPAGNSGYQMIINRTNLSGGTGWGLWVQAQKFGFWMNAATTQVNDPGSITANTWTHLAAVRNSSNLVTLYVNGTSVASTTVSSFTDSTTALGIGARGETGSWNAEYGVFGYISNARIVKGTAVYTANFTPPTAPLTAITNTSLLTCQSNRFIDNSSNAFTITRNGDVSVQAFSPFNPTAAWSAATNGGSGYFDGSGDYLTTNATQAIPATGDFTIEAWVYPTVSGPGRNIVSQGTTGTSGRLQLNVHTDNTLQFAITSTIVYSTGTVQPFAWNYVAVTRTGSSVAFYINGASAGTATLSGTVQNTTLSVGSEWSGDPYRWLGYLTSVRISNTLRTISSSPTAPLTSDGNTVFLCNFTNAGIYDATSKNDLETVGNAQISTTQSKFGGSSMYFDGTGDGLRQTVAPLWSFGTADFTIEAWVYPTAFAAGSSIITGQNQNSGTAALSIALALNASGQPLVLAAASTGAYAINFTGTALSLNTWTHVAVTRYGNTFTIWQNGISTATASSSVSISQDSTAGGYGGWNIGYSPISGQTLTGYIDDFRFTKGVARYTTNFTAPTAAFPLL